LPLRILVIDDTPDDLILLGFALEDAGLRVQALHRVETAAELQAALEEQAWDLCLLDWVMPALTTPEAMRLLRQSKQPRLPCIVWSGRDDPKVKFVAEEVLGAAAFIPKSRIAELPALVRTHVSRHRVN
jgi:CheY-like chemotaxis protein